MNATRYVLSFSAGGLLFHEAIAVAEELLVSNFDWELALHNVIGSNLLQSRTESTAKRKLREVRNRLKTLSRDQIRLLVNGSRQEQKLLLWMSCCFHYYVLADFAREVLRAKFLQLDMTVDRGDVERFIENKAIWHEELEDLAPSTRTKLETVMLRMLRESEMLSPEGIILPPIFSERLCRVILDDSPDHFLLFPAPLPKP